MNTIINEVLMFLAGLMVGTTFSMIPIKSTIKELKKQQQIEKEKRLFRSVMQTMDEIIEKAKKEKDNKKVKKSKTTKK